MPHVIGVVATLKIKPNQTETFEAAMRKMREQVKANESGCLIYDMHRSEEPNTYVMIEQYVNQAALDAHRSTSHM
ncbi:MAG: putative quinol monooxygenase, partial [Gammaproteobacteria bacterium]